MNKTTNIAVLTATAALLTSSTARAQTPGVAETGFLNVSIAAQTQSRDLSTSSTFPLYGETARIASAQRIGSGPVFDVSGGYRFKPAFAVGIGVSTFSRSATGTILASIPNPLVFNRPVNVSVEQSGLKHSELGVHLMAIWFVPVTVNFDVMLSAGPSFTRVKQDIGTATVPAGTQNVSVAVESRTATAKGANVGIVANYLFASHYGAGAFMRYVGGSVDFPEATGVKVAGFQIGAGVTVRF